MPSIYSAIGIALALAGSTLMVYSDEKRGEALTSANDPAVLAKGAEGVTGVR